MGQHETMSYIKGGTFFPLYGSDTTLVQVSDFYLDKTPVTNDQFLQFVKEHPKWQRDQVIKLFADENYLFHWSSNLEYEGEENAQRAVTNVSWFAAKDYCSIQGKRLPTIDEWEYTAMADETRTDAREDSFYNQRILSWYETPKTYNQSVGMSKPNVYGIYDLHGLVWEWTYDFNSVLVSGESRKDVDLDRNLFCAGGAVGATDLMNYAAFIRYAFRGSLKANYAVRTLGFRCAKDAEDEK